jgi:hypothetical protein
MNLDINDTIGFIGNNCFRPTIGEIKRRNELNDEIGTCFRNYRIRKTKNGKNYPKINLEDIRLVLQWIDDIVSGEIISTTDYTGSYFGFKKNISTKELDIICDHINPILKELNYPIRISWVAGEIRPVTAINRIIYLDAL